MFRHRLADPWRLAWHNHGIALNGQQRFVQAQPVLQTSLRMDPSSADAWCNLGLAYFGAEAFAQAQRAFSVAISLDQHHPASHVNMGNALISLFQPEQALRYLERGVQLEQSSANSLWNLALAYLLTGDFKRGWDYYEARFSTENFTDDVRPSTGPQPQSLELCSRDPANPLLVWTEQGIGDAIQFGRYLALLQASGVQFLFMTRKPLIRLFRDWLGLGDRQSNSAAHPGFRRTAPDSLLWLPKLLGMELVTCRLWCSTPTCPRPPRRTCGLHHRRYRPLVSGLRTPERRCIATRVPARAADAPLAHVDGP